MVFRFLVPYILPNHLLIPTYRRGKISPGPEMMANIAPFSTQVGTGYVDRTFPFDKTNYLRYRIFWWHRYHHMDMICHNMPFLYQTLFLPRQPMKYLSKLLPDLPKKRLPPVLRNKNNT